MEDGHTYHVGYDIAGTLKKSDKWLNGMLRDSDTGKDLTGPQVRGLLRREQEKGKTGFTGCGNTNELGWCQGHKQADA